MENNRWEQELPMANGREQEEMDDNGWLGWVWVWVDS